MSMRYADADALYTRAGEICKRHGYRLVREAGGQVRLIWWRLKPAPIPLLRPATKHERSYARVGEALLDVMLGRVEQCS